MPFPRQDEAPHDPTGTIGIRNQFREDFHRRWRKVDELLRDAIVGRNLFGFDGITVDNLSTNKVQMFNSFIDTATNQIVNGQWVTKYIKAAYDQGVANAKAKLHNPAVVPVFSSADILSDTALSETQGIVASTVQQSARAFSQALLSKLSSSKAYDGCKNILAKVGLQRTTLSVDFGVMRAHNEAMLDVFSAAGVKQVGLDVCTACRSHHVIGDARKPETIPRNKRPNTRQRNLIARREAKLNKLGMVNVQTMEDDRVCPVCERIAENGPYTIDQARGLIPAHPNDRCIFIPLD